MVHNIHPKIFAYQLSSYSGINDNNTFDSDLKHSISTKKDIVEISNKAKDLYIQYKFDLLSDTTNPKLSQESELRTESNEQLKHNVTIEPEEPWPEKEDSTSHVTQL